MGKYFESFEDIAKSNTIKWYHKLWLWMFPVRIKEGWTLEGELFRIYIKWVFGRLWVIKIEQLTYNVEKHISDLSTKDYPIMKVLKSIGGRHNAGLKNAFQWGKEE